MGFGGAVLCGPGHKTVEVMVGSLALQMMGKKEQSNFVGQWAPTLLILGLYNKIVKVAGSD